MKDTIELRKTAEEHNYLRKLVKAGGGESTTYVLKTSNPSIQVKLDGGEQWIRPVGGPVLRIGEYLEEAGSVIKSIDFVAGFGYTITFETSEDKELYEELLGVTI